MATTIPDWTDYPKLVKLKTDPLFTRAEELKSQITGLETELADLKSVIAAKMSAADARTVSHNGYQFAWSEGGETRTLDKDWATKTLLVKGVSTKEIEAHTKVSQRKSSLRITSPKEGD